MSERRPLRAAMTLRVNGTALKVDLYDSAEWWAEPTYIPGTYRVRVGGRWWAPDDVGTGPKRFHFATLAGVGHIVAGLLAGQLGMGMGATDEDPPVRRGQQLQWLTAPSLPSDIDGMARLEGPCPTRARADATRDPQTGEWMVEIYGSRAPVRLEELHIVAR